MKRCSKLDCQEDNPSDAIFCHMCGRKMKTRKKWPILVGVFISLLVVLGILFFIVPIGSNATNFTVNGVSFKMIKVNGGSFYMGATPECDCGEAQWWEKPIHRVRLDEYYIGETEVTQELWEEVMGYNPSEKFVGRNYPVNCVSWDDCIEFCRVLSLKTGKRFRLPTEAEWEYAARGGNKSKLYKFSGSNNLYQVAWCLDNSDSIPHQVKTKKPNELGIYDMTGNAWEWCSDYWSEKYNDSPQNNPKGPAYGEYRVHRGGGWLNLPKSCRISYRHYARPGRKNDYRGFRLAMDD